LNIVKKVPTEATFTEDFKEDLTNYEDEDSDDTMSNSSEEGYDFSFIKRARIDAGSDGGLGGYKGKGKVEAEEDEPSHKLSTGSVGDDMFTDCEDRDEQRMLLDHLAASEETEAPMEQGSVQRNPFGPPLSSLLTTSTVAQGSSSALENDWVEEECGFPKIKGIAVRVTEVALTEAEADLYNDLRLGRHRAREPSSLRLVWEPIWDGGYTAESEEEV
jgi:hypothetical protein